MPPRPLGSLRGVALGLAATTMLLATGCNRDEGAAPVAPATTRAPTTLPSTTVTIDEGARRAAIDARLQRYNLDDRARTCTLDAAVADAGLETPAAGNETVAALNARLLRHAIDCGARGQLNAGITAAILVQLAAAPDKRGCLTDAVSKLGDEQFVRVAIDDAEAIATLAARCAIAVTTPGSAPTGSAPPGSTRPA